MRIGRSEAQSGNHDVRVVARRNVDVGRRQADAGGHDGRNNHEERAAHIVLNAVPDAGVPAASGAIQETAMSGIPPAAAG